MMTPQTVILVALFLALFGCRYSTPHHNNRIPQTPSEWVAQHMPDATISGSHLSDPTRTTWEATINGLAVIFHRDPIHGVYFNRHTPQYTPGRGYRYEPN